MRTNQPVADAETSNVAGGNEGITQAIELSNGSAHSTGAEAQAQVRARTSSRCRAPVQRFANNICVCACDWKQSMGLVCASGCNCANSISMQEEEKALKVCGLDTDVESWGVEWSQNEIWNVETLSQPSEGLRSCKQPAMREKNSGSYISRCIRRRYHCNHCNTPSHII